MPTRCSRRDKGPEAGRTAADAVRFLRDRCPKITAPLRTPSTPARRGFLVVWVLHANDAPPVTFLAGETRPTQPTRSTTPSSAACRPFARRAKP